MNSRPQSLSVARVEALVAASPAAGAAPPAPPADAARERSLLLGALTQLFRALRDPSLAALVHPPVPGSTLPLGARVPGTSLELEPAHAAAGLAALLYAAPAPAEAALAPALAAADFAARRAHYHGREPPTLEAVYAALARARLHQHTVAAAQGEADPRLAARRAGAYAAALLLGADEASSEAAAQSAARAGAAAPHAHAAAYSPDADPAPGHDVAACRAAGEDAALALRHALASVAGEPRAIASGARIAPTAPASSPPPMPRPTSTPASSVAAPPAQLDADFAAAAAALFPARRLPALLGTFADDAALRALPVDALFARLARN